jgi:copper chaperone
MKFQVQDMTCQHCVKSITAAIQAVDSSAQVQCDVATHEVVVVATIDQTVINQAIIEAGYTIS